MKKSLTLVCALFLAGGLMAQSNQLSLGVDAALPFGDFGNAFGLGIGPAAGFEIPLGDNLAVTAQISYLFLSPESAAIKSASMIPAQFGAKYHLAGNQTGIYIHALAGIHATRSTTEDFSFGPVVVAGQTTSDSNFSWGGGVGFQMEKFDVGARFNSITAPSEFPGATASNYVGLRIAYLLGF